MAPGELISIFGIGLGPTTAVSAPSGALPTTLGGTTVSINGTAAPLNFSSYFELQVQAPFGLVTGTVAQLQITFNNQATSPILLSVVSAAPGLFTKTQNGLGPVSAANQDGTLNSTTHPAPKGTVIVFYASGLGAVSPPVAAGAVPGRRRRRSHHWRSAGRRSLCGPCAGHSRPLSN